MKNIKKKFSEIFSVLSAKFQRSKSTTGDKGNTQRFINRLKFDNLKDLKRNVPRKISSYEFGSLIKKVSKHFFNVQNRPIIHRIFVVAVLAILPYIVGKIIALVLTIPENTPKNLTKIYVPTSSDVDLTRDIEKFQTSNLFHAKLINDFDETGKKKKNVDINVACTTAQTKSSLPIKLLSTIVLQNSKKSLAAIFVGGGESELKTVREDEKIDDMAKIGKIERLKIIFRSLQSGECEYIGDEEELASFGGKKGSILSPRDGKKLMNSLKQMDGIKNDGDQFYISKKLFNEKLQEIDRILRDARAVPMQNPDGSMSFKITELVPGSIYSYLGIEENDKITKINGKKIAGLNEIMNLFASLQNIEKLQLTVIKDDGNEHTFNYAFSK